MKYKLRALDVCKAYKKEFHISSAKETAEYRLYRNQ